MFQDRFYSVKDTVSARVLIRFGAIQESHRETIKISPRSWWSFPRATWAWTGRCSRSTSCTTTASARSRSCRRRWGPSSTRSRARAGTVARLGRTRNTLHDRVRESIWSNWNCHQNVVFFIDRIGFWISIIFWFFTSYPGWTTTTTSTRTARPTAAARRSPCRWPPGSAPLSFSLSLSRNRGR